MVATLGAGKWWHGFIVGYTGWIGLTGVIGLRVELGCDYHLGATPGAAITRSESVIGSK